jgi:hypothetical protein
MKSIDVKSLLIGILGTALVMVLMGLTHSSKGEYSPWCLGPSKQFEYCYLTNLETGVTKHLSWPREKHKLWGEEDLNMRIFIGNKPNF